MYGGHLHGARTLGMHAGKLKPFGEHAQEPCVWARPGLTGTCSRCESTHENAL